MEPIGGAWIQFNIRYYMFALVFLVFDVETVFLYPWAVAFHRLGLLAFIEALIFIAILVVALVYAGRKAAKKNFKSRRAPHGDARVVGKRDSDNC
ncbi:NADH dehydrogenase subunit A [Microseira wollei NIES-4236]|uniref:NADH dehydrogenase subunit A n=1 Tax=Microseira wollei NIES-4236 TaxID=2530354 RepID=A0AAV3XHJ1_9CYAN|nr:NADH dehydrogenase subunit A [Microseira wollei NIES-4236]